MNTYINPEAIENKSITKDKLSDDLIFDIKGEIPKNEIWYTSSDGAVITPYATNVFGANIVSNTYENGKGIITFDGEVISIGKSAFEDCSSLTSVTIPDSVTSMGRNAFYNCSSLTRVDITDLSAWCKISFSLYANPLDNGAKLYLNGRELTDMTIPSDITSIGGYAFRGCSSLTSVTIGNSVTSIGMEAFSYCSSLSSVTIGNIVTKIGDRAFTSCRSLTSVTIGNSVTSIGADAFRGCTSLTSVTIGNSVTSIGADAFRGCTSLTSITIPNSVTSIGDRAFDECGLLMTINIKNYIPGFIGDSSFRNNSQNFKICIPVGTLQSYISATNWSNYAEHMYECVFEDENLVSGENIKTLNGESILGKGDITITTTTTTMVEITYDELKSLRDSSQLVPGQQYRIIDYVTTTDQPRTKSAGHQFDIIVTADTNNVLNEKARACLHNSKKMDLSLYDVCYREGDMDNEYIYQSDYIYEGKSYRLYKFEDEDGIIRVLIDFDKYNNSPEIPEEYECSSFDYCIYPDYVEFNEEGEWYPGEEEGFILEFEFDPNINYPYHNAYDYNNDYNIKYIGEYEYLGKVYSLYDNNNDTQYLMDFSNPREIIDTGGKFKYGVYPDFRKPSDDDWIIGNDGDLIWFKYNPNDSEKYFSKNKLESWEIWYSLDNDMTRFAWASNYFSPDTNKKMLMLNDNYTTCCDYNYVFVRDESYDENGKCAWIVDDSWNSHIMDNDDHSFRFYVRDCLGSLNTDEIIFTENENPTIGDIFHTTSGWVLKLLNISVGKGVIYRMIDEFGNDCPYDFKNIQYLNDLSIDDYAEGNIKWYYTFAGYSHNIEHDYYRGVEDYEETLDGSLVSPFSYCGDPNTAFHNNIIKPLILQYDDYSNDVNDWNNHIGRASLNNIIMCGVWDEIGSSYDEETEYFSICCCGNFFDVDCMNNYFGNACYHNTFGNGCCSNTFGNYCRDNTFGDSCYSNTFGNYCHSNIFGNSCGSNTFGDNCYDNKFGNGFYNNKFKYSCNYNTFGNGCGCNTFGNYCWNNKFGDYCWNNSLGSYYRYIIFDNGNKLITLNATSTTSSSKYYQNVRIGLGVNNTNNEKIINDPNVAQTYETLYIPANSQTITI